MTQRTFKVPMSIQFLPQAHCVQMLLDTLHNIVLPNLTNEQARNVIVCSSSIFTHEQTVCSLSLIDLMNKANELGITLTTAQGTKLLNDAVKDVRDNYANQAIEFHLNQYQEELERTNAK